MFHRIWYDYNKNRQYRLGDSSKVSPGLEAAFFEDDVVYVNVNKRLSDVFEPREVVEEDIAVLKMYQDEPKYQELFDVITHYIAMLDRVSGFSMIDGVAEIEQCAIESGRYGEFVKKEFAKLENSHRYIFLNYLARYDMAHQKNMLLYLILDEVFGDISVYHEVCTNIVHVYLPVEKSEYNQSFYNLITYVFQHIDTSLEVMWEGEHFGIVGKDENMIIGEIAIY